MNEHEWTADRRQQPARPTPPATRRPAYGPRVSGHQMRDVNRLRRSRSDRYIAGVAGGLGRHFDIDPTVIRVLLAVLTFFGGAGVLVYGVVWLFVPEDGEDRAPVELNPDILKIVLVVTGAIALMIVFGTPFFNDSWGFGLPLPAADHRPGGGRDLRHPRPASPRRPVPPATLGQPSPSAPATPTPAPVPHRATEGTTMSTTDTPTETIPDAPGSYQPPAYQTGYQSGQQPPAWMPPPPPAYVPPPRPRRTGLVLFWPTLALIAIALGILGIVDVEQLGEPLGVRRPGRRHHRA